MKMMKTKVLSAMIALILIVMPIASLAENKDVKLAGAYEKLMDEALQKALLLELDTTASLLNGHTGRATAAALVSLLKAANEIESDNDSDQNSDKNESKENKDQNSANKSSDTSKKISDSAYKRAAQYGGYIRDVDTQLIFCSLLKEEGYDIAKVYPDGVEVDIDLHQYQPKLFMDLDAAIAETHNEPMDLSKILVFSREDDQKPKLTWDTTLDSAKILLDEEKMEHLRYEKEYEYTVKLRVDQMQNENLSELFANNLSECKAIVILDKGYCFDCRKGYTQTDSNGVQTHHYAFGYGAFESVTVFSVNDPLNHTVYDLYMNESDVYNATFENNGSEALTIVIPHTEQNGNVKQESHLVKNHNSWNTEKNMIGKFEENWLDQYTKSEKGLTKLEKLISILSAKK